MLTSRRNLWALGLIVPAAAAALAAAAAGPASRPVAAPPLAPGAAEAKAGTDAKPGAHADATIKSFLATYCVECHGPDKQKAERRFDQLALPAKHPDALTDLQDIIDQLNLGEMPPKKSRQPSEREAKEAVALLTRAAEQARAALASTGAQTVLRRLNRREYRNTVGDLFAMDMSMFDPTGRFPRDQAVGHMDNIGDALKTSGYLLEQYLDAADQVVEKALRPLGERPREQTWTFDKNFVQQPELRYSHGKVHQHRYLCLYESTASEKHEGAYGPINGFNDGAPADGYYEVRVLAEAVNRLHPYDPKLFGTDRDAPFRLGVVAGNHKAGHLYHPQPIEPELDETVLADGPPQWKTFRVWLDQGYTPRFTFPNGMLDVRRAWIQILSRYRDTFPEEARQAKGIVEARVAVQRHGKIPHIRIHEVQIRGPIDPAWPPASHQAVLGDKPFEPGQTREILKRFADRAYRRPATTDEVDRLMAVVRRRQQDGATPFQAMKDGLKAALCSPAFLYLAEPQAAAAAAAAGTAGRPATRPAGNKLSAHALAARLSYFLWSTTPDAELSRLAASGELLRDDVLVAQVRRLLASPRSGAFVTGFLDAWLNLRSLGDMPPDRAAFQRYYAHGLQPAMRQETELFARDLIDRNDSLVRFLDADYTFLNRPLAQLYGLEAAIPPDRGHEFRRVKLPDRTRGGLLGQGSVLTVTANGIETSPVIRGVWLLENILGTPPAPPPDNVPAIDPDVRGAKSMRDLLTKHRDNPACYDCHQKIDPLGFALENFDPIGGWRARYPQGGPIDASGELPGGQAFKDVAGLKQVLVDRKDQFARMLAERMLMYACGRRIEATDRPHVDRAVEAARRENYGMRNLIEQVVLSDAFRSK